MAPFIFNTYPEYNRKLDKLFNILNYNAFDNVRKYSSSGGKI